MPTIAVDAMGGDRGAPLVVPAVAALCEEEDDLSIVLVGRESDIRHVLAASGREPSDALSIVNADEVVYDTDDPLSAYRE